MNTTTTGTQPGQVSAALSTAACLIATAALVTAAGAVQVRVVVTAGRISLQVPLDAGDQATRIQAVAAYAGVLGSQVTDRDGRIGVCGETWVETWGQIDGHEVHVWTITDPDPTSGADPTGTDSSGSGKGR